MEALQPKVGPALQASFSQVGAELVNHAVKINTLEHEVRMLKIRTAWTEKDLMYSQIEAAKRTLVVRNFPEWATAADRELTAAEALKENNLGYLECDFTTTTMEGTDGKKLLAPISSRTTPAPRKSRRPGPGSRAPAHRTIRGEPATITQRTTTWEKRARPHSPHRRSGNLPIKMSPGITQFERRLGAPLHGLMNAYQRLFAHFMKESLVPRWNTLILEDKEGAWLERILNSRKTSSLTGTTGTVATGSARSSCPRSTWTVSWSAGVTSGMTS